MGGTGDGVALPIGPLERRLARLTGDGRGEDGRAGVLDRSSGEPVGVQGDGVPGAEHPPLEQHPRAVVDREPQPVPLVVDRGLHPDEMLLEGVADGRDRQGLHAVTPEVLVLLLEVAGGERRTVAGVLQRLQVGGCIRRGARSPLNT